MWLWRVSNNATLEGLGGLVASARWHTKGRLIVYLAESPAGAVVERLVHLEVTLDQLPKTYQLIQVDVPDGLGLPSIAKTLPDGWQHDLLASRTIGDEWLARNDSALLRVPSALLPETFNVLLNPRHGDVAQVNILWSRMFPRDERLLE
jgi:RES domain-containing protein